MQKFTSSIKITSFDKKISELFIKKLKLIGGHKSYQNLFIPKGYKIIKKKNTILKSPHIFKKFRDQIEIQHYSNFIELMPATFSKELNSQPASKNLEKALQGITFRPLTLKSYVLEGNKNFWLFFFLSLKKYHGNTNPIKLDYRHTYTQIIFYM